MICEHCHEDATHTGLVIHGTELWCRVCHVVSQGDPAHPSHGVVGDEIDIWVKHGLCHSNGDPRHFRSRKEMAAVAKAKGMVNMVRTATTPGPNTHRKVFGMYGRTKGSTQQ